MSPYKLFIIQTSKKKKNFLRRAWQQYDTVFREEAAASSLRDWSKMDHDLYHFCTLVSSNTCSASSILRQLRESSSLTSQDHNPNSSQFCHSWNAGNVIGLLAVVGFATPVMFAARSTNGKPALTSLHSGNAGLGHPTPAEKKCQWC